jgi:hypothetical protein
MEHWRDKRFGYHNGIRIFWSFGQSKAQKLNSDLLLFCLEMKFSSDIDRQNSVTSKLIIEWSHMSNG